MSKENLCLASKSASASSRSIFAFVLETVNRIPVNMLYAVTQLTWFMSTFVPTTTLSSSSSSFLCLRLALFCRIVSVHRATSPSSGTSSGYISECTDRVGARTRVFDARGVRGDGEKRPLSLPPSLAVLGNEKSLDVRLVDTLGTSKVV